MTVDNAVERLCFSEGTLYWTNRLGVLTLIHYLDDYLTMGKEDTASGGAGKHRPQTWITIEMAKARGPICDTVLGVLLDTHRMEMHLPQVKLKRLNSSSLNG